MSGFKVLIVDDEEDFLETLAARLRLRDLDVQAVTTGEEALDVLGEREADVVILDVRLPGMSGVQALEKIKERFPLIEVMILTGYADAKTAIRVMELGAFDYLVKPVAITQLLYRLQDAHRKKVLREQDLRDHKGL
jgi:DNA-binding NtrC family response regulator